MTVFVALLRAVNVGGTGQLAMPDLVAVCETAGFRQVKTYIASGNVVFASEGSEPEVKRALEAGLAKHVGQPIGVLLRTAADLADIRDRNPFPEAPGNRVVVLFLDAPGQAALDGISGIGADEAVQPGHRELYVFYGSGMGQSKLKLPAAKSGTGRNMNTVSRLADMAATLVGQQERA